MFRILRILGVKSVQIFAMMLFGDTCCSSSPSTGNQAKFICFSKGLSRPLYGALALSAKLTTRPVRAALRTLVREWRIMRAHRRGVRKALAATLPCALHIGCGPNRKPGWINIDLNQDADICLDLPEPLPFPDNSVKMVYSEHFFEHLDASRSSTWSHWPS